MELYNALYAQSGGVTAVINASACGVIETVRQNSKKIGKLFAARNGIIGALTEDLIDTTQDSDADIAALRHTPAGAFGSCRHKLGSLDKHRAQYERLIEVFSAHNIRYFFYNGGGDSQDTANKVSQISQSVYNMYYELKKYGESFMAAPRSVPSSEPFRPYLSLDLQKQIAKTFNKTVIEPFQKALGDYILEKISQDKVPSSDLKAAPLSPSQIEQEFKESKAPNRLAVAKSKIARWALHRINQLEEKLAEYLKSDPPPPPDSRALYSVLGQIEEVVKQASKQNTDIEKLEGSFWRMGGDFKTHLDRMGQICDQERAALKTAYDYHIYSATVPQEWLKQKEKSSIIEEFDYKAGPTTVAGVVGTGLVAVGVVAVTILGAVLGAEGGAGLSVPVLDGLDVGGGGGPSAMGLSAKEDIPGNYITAKVSSDGKREANPHFVEDKRFKSMKEIFIVEAGRPPDHTFKYGTDHMLDDRQKKNPHGHIIFFNDLKSAQSFCTGCSRNRVDPIAGIRRHHAWKDEQRKFVYDNYASVQNARLERARQKAGQSSHAVAGQALATAPSVPTAAAGSTKSSGLSSMSKHATPAPSAPAMVVNNLPDFGLGKAAAAPAGKAASATTTKSSTSTSTVTGPPGGAALPAHSDTTVSPDVDDEWVQIDRQQSQTQKRPASKR